MAVIAGRKGSSCTLQLSRTMQFCCVLFSLILKQSVFGAATDDSERAEIHQMPRLFQFEDKQKCLAEDLNNIYCATKTVIKPDNNSAIWRLIEKNSREYTNYRHYIFDRGSCLKNCISSLADLTEDQLHMYDQERIPVADIYMLGSEYIYGMEEYKRRYGKMINICLNRRLRQSHNLSGYSEIEHCVTGADLDKPLTILHVIFAALYGTILILVARATFRNIKENIDSGTCSSTESQSDIWMEFSLLRSFRRLTVAPKTKLQRDFAFVESIRVVLVLVICMTHSIIALGGAPISNPAALESLFGNPVVRMAATVFPMLPHTFFTISGMLLAVHFLAYIEEEPKFRWNVFFVGALTRYLRMIPSYFMVWLYQISWLDRLGNGPYSYKVTGIETQMCTINGWSNLLFINNYYGWDKSCMQQTWYLATDFQFYLVGFVLMMLLWRYPRSANVMLTAVTILSFVVPVIHLYIHNSAGLIRANAKHLHTYCFHDEPLRNDYILAHTNFSAYFAGFIAGLVYHRVQKDPECLNNLRIYHRLKWLAPLMFLLMAAPATLFYDIEPSTGRSLFRAVYAAAFRSFYGITCAVGLLYAATDGARRFPTWTKHPTVLAIGRLSFCVFLVQFNAFRLFLVDVDGYGLVMNVFNYLYASSTVVVYSYCFGLVLCVTVELPVAAVIRQFRGSTNNHTTSTEKDTTKTKSS